MKNILKNKSRKVLAFIKANVNVEIPVKGVENSGVFIAPLLKSELSTKNSGTNIEVRTYTISDSIMSNRKVALIDCEITLKQSNPGGDGTTEYFKTIPHLKSKDKNFSITIVSKETSVGKINKCRFRIYYINKKSTTKIRPLKCVVDYDLSTRRNKIVKIHNINVGRKAISSNGENRLITISGTPGAKYGFTVNERILDENGVYTGKHNDVTIISRIHKHNNIGVMDSNYNTKMRYIYGIIGKNGVSTFNQSFPSNVVSKTKISTGATSATQTFNSVNGIKVGDKIYSSVIPKTSSVTVNSINTSNNTCVLSESVNLATGAQVDFKRKRSYGIDLVEKAFDRLDENFIDISLIGGSNIPMEDGGRWPENWFTFYQTLETDILIRHSMTGGGSAFATITSNNGVATSLNRGDSLDVKTSSKPGRYHKEIKFSMLITLSSGHVGSVSVPAVSSSSKRKSLWTNSNVKQNGGSMFKVKDFSHTTLGLTTVTVSYKVCIFKFGVTPLVFELSLNDIITLA